MNTKILKSGIIIQVLFALSSCDNLMLREDHEKELEYVTAIEEHKTDSLSRAFRTTMDEIDRNLDHVRDRYGVLALDQSIKLDDGQNVRDRILNTITSINAILADNKRKIYMLNRNMNQLKKGKNELSKSLEIASARLEEQQAIIESIKAELLKKDFKIEELSQTIAVKTDSIKSMIALKEEKRRKLERKYFTYGTKQELKLREVIKSNKGIKALTQGKQINPDFDTTGFCAINMYERTEMEFIGIEPKLLTAHPAGTYTLTEVDDNSSKLKIKNPDQFWRTSNYLIVQVK